MTPARRITFGIGNSWLAFLNKRISAITFPCYPVNLLTYQGHHERVTIRQRLDRFGRIQQRPKHQQSQPMEGFPGWHLRLSMIYRSIYYYKHVFHLAYYLLTVWLSIFVKKRNLDSNDITHFFAYPFCHGS